MSDYLLSAALADSVSAFVGHPKLCPRDKPIPAGPCCRSFSKAVEPLVQPLDRLAWVEPAIAGEIYVKRVEA